MNRYPHTDSRWVITPALVLVNVFHRIFDGDDVAARLLVAVAHHRGERSALARARAAHEQDEPALAEHDFFQDRRQVQLLEGRNLGI